MTTDPSTMILNSNVSESKSLAVKLPSTAAIPPAALDDVSSIEETALFDVRLSSAPTMKVLSVWLISFVPSEIFRLNSSVALAVRPSIAVSFGI